MRKKLFIITMIVVLGVVLSLTALGCSSGNNADPGSNRGNEETINLTFAHPFPAAHPIQVEIIDPFVEEIKEKSNGRINITVHPGGSITTGTSAYDDIASGAIDMGWTLQGYTAGRFPLTELVEIPGDFTSAVQATDTLWGLLEQSKEFQEEYGDVKLFNIYTTDIGDIYNSKKTIRTPADLIGISLRSASPMSGRSLEAFGATTANMPMPDAYDNIERGVVDGLATAQSAIDSYRLYEVINYATSGLNLYVSPQVMAMSWDAWNRLSPEDQKLFDSLTGRQMGIKSAQSYDDHHERAYKVMQDNGVEIYHLTDEDRAKFYEASASVLTDYIEILNKNGLPGQEFYNLMIQIRDSL